MPAFTTQHQSIYSDLSYAMSQSRCRECAYLRRVLDQLTNALYSNPDPDAQALGMQAIDWLAVLNAPRHEDLGCAPCYSNNALQVAAGAFPAREADTMLPERRILPPGAGGLTWLDPLAPVGVLSLSGPELAQTLVERRPAGLAVAGWFGEPSQAGDLLTQCLAHPNLRYLILAGCEACDAAQAAKLFEQARITALAAIKLRLTPGEALQPISSVQIIDLRGVSGVQRIVDEVYELLIATLELSAASGST